MRGDIRIRTWFEIGLEKGRDEDGGSFDMKPRLWVPMLVATLVALVAAAPTGVTQQPSGDVDERAIAKLIEETERANNAGDVEAWVELFADDAVYMTPGSAPVATREGLIEVAEAGFRHQADIDIEPLEIRVGATWAFARTRVSGTVTLRDSGEIVPIDAKQIVIYRRDAGERWRIARMIGNGNTQ